mmetsp:Transcript_73687/g.204130  ORF Transcript_73687/g.204130 Transcript_73687/m.204130 type:complete len:164 (+) Transcript_73687:334-825(+)
MYFRKHLETTLAIHPMYFGPDLRDVIREKLVEDVEGTQVAANTYVITVMDVADDAIKHGVLDHLTGMAKYTVKYEALMFKLFKHEVCDGVVKVASDLGFFVTVGPTDVFVAHEYIPGDYRYVAESAAWVQEDGTSEIKRDTKVRIFIHSSSIGSLELEFTGPL